MNKFWWAGHVARLQKKRVTKKPAWWYLWNLRRPVERLPTRRRDALTSLWMRAAKDRKEWKMAVDNWLRSMERRVTIPAVADLQSTQYTPEQMETVCDNEHSFFNCSRHPFARYFEYGVYVIKCYRLRIPNFFFSPNSFFSNFDADDFFAVKLVSSQRLLGCT